MTVPVIYRLWLEYRIILIKHLKISVSGMCFEFLKLAIWLQAVVLRSGHWRGHAFSGCENIQKSPVFSIRKCVKVLDSYLRYFGKGVKQ